MVFEFGSLPSGAELSSDGSQKSKKKAPIEQSSPKHSKRVRHESPRKGQYSDDGIAWADMSSSSPIKPQSIFSPAKIASTRVFDSVPLDPAMELLEKYQPKRSGPLLTWPLADNDQSTSNTSKPMPAKKAGSVANTTAKSVQSLRNPEKLRHLHSPGYLKRSLSVEVSSKGSVNAPKFEGSRPEQQSGGVRGLIDLAERLSRSSSADKPDSSPNDKPEALKEELENAFFPSSPPELANKSTSLPHIKPETIPNQNVASDDSFDDFELAQIDAQVSRRLTERKIAEAADGSDDAPGIVEPPDPPSPSAHNQGSKLPIIPDIEGVTDSDIDDQELDAFVRSKEQHDKTNNEDTKKDNDSKSHTPAKVQRSATIVDECDFSDSSEDDELLLQAVNDREKKARIFKSSQGFLARDEPKEESSAFSILSKPVLRRFVIISVEDSTYPSKRGTRTEYVLAVQDAIHSMFTVRLRDSWLAVRPNNGDVINVIGEFVSNKEEIIVDDQQNLAVILPDVLVTCTEVADSFFCQRKVIIRNRVRGQGDLPNTFMLYGDILHRVFQTCLEEDDFSEDFMDSTLVKLVHREYFETALLIGVSLSSVISELRQRLPRLRLWSLKYYLPQPTPDSVFHDHRRDNGNATMSVSKVLAIEQEVWSPMFGLKGKIDVTVESNLSMGNNSGTYVAPFEIKTSTHAQSMSHRAQTTLYTLLLSDRYDVNVRYGILWYSHLGEVVRVPIFWDEIRPLLVRRNELATFVQDKVRYPDLKKSEHHCSKCSHRDYCMIIHRMVEDGNEQSSGVPDIFDYEAEHLTEQDAEFYRHWNALLDKESRSMSLNVRAIWTKKSSERESAGEGFGSLTIKPGPDGMEVLANGRYQYKLIRNGGSAFDGEYSLVNVSDHIVISDERGQICVSKGIIRSISTTEILVETPTPIDNSFAAMPGFNAEKTQVFRSLLHRSADKYAASVMKGNTTLRIDKDEFGMAISMARNNLLQLFVRSADDRRRQLIVGLETPRFADKAPDYKLPKGTKFNSDQERAIDTVMKAKDYCLILGMPGTGKTTTIAGLIRLLMARKQTVLLVSYTHSAVDNILVKIKDDDYGKVRVGAKGRVHPEVAHLVPNFEMGDESKFDEEEFNRRVQAAYFEPEVVATTCLGINNWLFTRRPKFDYCIVDEASQVTLPTCIGPLRMADKFILVGDHQQLSPLVRNADAMSGGLNSSLFQILSRAHPQSVVNLEYQYRMNDDIMFLSNELVYEGNLKSGTKEVANQVLHIPNPRALKPRKPLQPKEAWLDHVIKEE